jgi:radical SAM superfamily enzyme YgiQ (UPF0313 family)
MFALFRLKLLRRFSFAKRELLLLSLPWDNGKSISAPLGHASILASLRKANVDIIDKVVPVNGTDYCSQEVVNYIMENAAPNRDLGIGVFVWNEKEVQEILHLLNKHEFPGRIILGGPQITYVDHGLETLYPQANIFIRGHAEIALAKLMQQNITTNDTYSALGIQGVSHAGTNLTSSIANPNLEQLDSPILNGIFDGDKSIRWETQRGCMYSCAFCQYKKDQHSNECHEFPLERLLSEAKWIANNSSIKTVSVVDSVFNHGENYLKLLAKLHSYGYTGKLTLECRLELVTDSFLEILDLIGNDIEILIKFGLQTIHKNEQRAINRINNLKKINVVLGKFTELKAHTDLSLIFGLPEQTLSSFLECIEFCNKYDPLKISPFPLMLLRNTSLYNNKNKLGLFESSNPFQDGITRVTSTPTMSHKDWKHAYDLSLWMQTHYNNKSNQILTEQNSYYKTKSKKLLTKIGQFRYSQQNFKIRNNIKHSEKNNINTSNDKHLKL